MLQPHFNNEIWDDNNILGCKYSLNRSLKEQPCNLSSAFKVEKNVEKSITVSDLSFNMCPIKIALERKLRQLKSDSELILKTSKENMVKDYIPSAS